MFLTCGMAPAAASAATSMDYNGDFQAGYQEIDGINLGYLQINGTKMFALTQVFSDLFKDIPRAAVSKKMESLKIQSRRCDLKELRTLKAIQSVPMRAVKCSLISKTDLEALCTSCKALTPRKRKRKRKVKRREAEVLFDRSRLLPAYDEPDHHAFRASLGAGCTKREALFGAPFARSYEKTAPPSKSYSRNSRAQFLAGVLNAYPGDLQFLHSAVRAHGTGQPPREPEIGRPKRSTCGCLAKKGRSAAIAGSKRQGTSAGYSSDSDSSGASSPASSSDSSEDEEEEDDEEDDEEEEDESSCSSEDCSSSGSESSSLCSGDSVQSTRYRQAALPRLPPQNASSQVFPSVAKALRPDPNLIFWARTLCASTLESFKPVPTTTPKELQQDRSETRHSRPVGPSERPQPKNVGIKEASELGVQEGEEVDFLSIPGVRASEQDKTEEAALQQTSEEGSGRGAHFDRLIRQSKLWCYAKGFNVDGKGLRRAEQAKGCSPTSKAGLLSLANRPLKGSSDLERSARRSRVEQAKGRPPKIQRKKTPKGGTPPCKRLLSASPGPVRNPFTLMGTFPCTPALVVGSDGDLCPASSLCVKDSCALSKTHPLWTWQLGGNAIPMPPSLKFRGYGFEKV
ncbi:elongin BC and Polycomb repressive complex 2-associated protein [Ahaetulla prasina]|uniref:elongin BC and Polycomb repressive complex 2-associated protein n=1 Tax=Ahaetulla prasina TaxID=499056 RepID=UPI002648DF3F|nr:elongin BC and Polycomb repressive complex 2-associated protein [Ahaetulla prasina]